MKTEEELLEYYKEEIESGEVKKADLLSFSKLLKLDFVKDRNKVEKLLEDTISYLDIFKQWCSYRPLPWQYHTDLKLQV